VSQAQYDNLIEQGVHPGRAAKTIEYACSRCDTVTLLCIAGGEMNCECEPQDYAVTEIFAGSRVSLGWLSDISNHITLP
jgi:hypothetical protein